MAVMRSAFAVIRRHRRAYVVLNVLFYGLVVCGMVYVAFDPELQQSLIERTRGEFGKGMLKVVTRAYKDGNVPAAMGLTFVVNLVGGAFLAITVPSLVIPFSGLVLGVWRAVLWGLMLSPGHPELRLPMIPHALTVLIEGQAYVLTMLAAYVQGKAFLWPRSVGVETHGRGYRVGLKDSARLYLLIIAVLAVAAAYEAVELIYFVGPMVGAP